MSTAPSPQPVVPERPPWVPAARYNEMLAEVMSRVREEALHGTGSRASGKRATAIVALATGSAGIMASIWFGEGMVIIAACVALVAAGMLALRGTKAGEHYVAQTARDELAAELERYRRAQLSSPDFFHSEAWQTLRSSILERNTAQCARCGRRESAMLVVSHIQSPVQAPDLALEADNVEIVCHRCKNAAGELAGTA